MAQKSRPDGKGWVTNIQRFSLDDGPGIRTTIFLKGCSLRCSWCHNPECINPEAQIQFFVDRCTQCGACVAACPVQAQQIIDGKRIYRRDLCQRIGHCVKVCDFGALELVGKEITTSDIVTEVVKDRIFYQKNNGGVTISGGEPLLQNNFTRDILASCKKLGIHTAVDTAGNVPWQNFKQVIPQTDLFLYDLKCIDPGKHRLLTGSSNKLILDNLNLLVNEEKEIWIRIPLIPGINDKSDDILAFAKLLHQIPKISRIQIIPYHRYGVGKYASLGMEYDYVNINPPTDEIIKKIIALFSDQDINVEY